MIMSTIGALAILLLEHAENYADVHNLIQKYQAFVRSLLTVIQISILRMYTLVPII